MEERRIIPGIELDGFRIGFDGGFVVAEILSRPAALVRILGRCYRGCCRRCGRCGASRSLTATGILFLFLREFLDELFQVSQPRIELVERLSHVLEDAHQITGPLGVGRKNQQEDDYRTNRCTTKKA